MDQTHRSPYTFPSKVRCLRGSLYVLDHEADGSTFLIPGDVFDVTRKRDVYGKGCSYNLFAGKDGSRGLGMSSLKPEDAVPDYTNLPVNEMKVLDDWHSFFSYVSYSLLHTSCGYIGELTTTAASQETVQHRWPCFQYARSSSATTSTELAPFVFPLRSYVHYVDSNL